jgi:hypothetical protein
MLSADFIEYFLIDLLPVYRLAFGFKFFDYRLHHIPLNFFIRRYTRLSFAEST